MRKKAFDKQEQMGLNTIPIFIISFNRLSYLKELITRLEELGVNNNIIIIDNASTYQPLLDYYKTLPYKIEIMDQNYGYRVFWESSVFDKYRDDFYILTDPDVIPIKDCPNDFIAYFFSILKNYPNNRKAGFALKIDDLPKNGVFTDEIVEWEKQFWKFKIPNKELFIADIDTTFALYVPDYLARSNESYRGIRTGGLYQAQHLPWYKRDCDITEEDIFYSNLKTNGWWDFVKGEVVKE